MTRLLPDLLPALAPVTPRSFSGLVLWLAPRKLPSLRSGDPITTFADQSGQGSDFGNTGTARPTFVTDVLNGRPTARHDGTTQYSASAVFAALSGLAAFTLLSVWRTSDPAGNHVLFGTNGNTVVVQVFSSQLLTYIGALANHGDVAFSSTTPHILSVIYDGSQAGNAARLAVWLDGVPQTLAFTGTIPASIGASTGARLGDLFAGGTVWKDDIHEFVAYNRALPSAQRVALERAIGRGQYGLAVA